MEFSRPLASREAERFLQGQEGNERGWRDKGGLETRRRIRDWKGEKGRRKRESPALLDPS